MHLSITRKELVLLAGRFKSLPGITNREEEDLGRPLNHHLNFSPVRSSYSLMYSLLIFSTSESGS